MRLSVVFTVQDAAGTPSMLISAELSSMPLEGAGSL